MTQALSINSSVRSSGKEGAAVSSMVQLEPGIEDLAERAQGGCRESFDALVARFEKRIFQYLYQMTRNLHDAEDLTQITFLKAYQNIHRYESHRAFNAWLFTIAKRTALNHFRDSRPAEELGPHLEANTENPSVALEKEDARSDVWRVARTLRPDQYEALWLRYAEDFSISEVARIMESSSLRVRVLLHRARAALGKRLTSRNTGRATRPNG